MIDLDVRFGSEFDETYGEEPSHPPETITEDLLVETLDRLKIKKPICVSPNDVVEDVVRGMGERNHGCVLVKEGEQLVGIFTERDVVRRVVGKVDPKVARVREVMTPDPEAVMFHDTLAVALNKMTVGGFRHVPLVDNQHRPVGVVSVKDIVHIIVEHFPRNVLNVAPDPVVRNPDRVAGGG
jgi:CBS domain-containing protein